jgi:hypothetical protein
MSTRLHRSEVRHQLDRLAREGGPKVSVRALEERLGYPLAEADHANLRGMYSALAAVADALTSTVTST